MKTLHQMLCEEYQILLYKDLTECDAQEVKLKFAIELILEDLYKKQNNPMD